MSVVEESDHLLTFDSALTSSILFISSDAAPSSTAKMEGSSNRNPPVIVGNDGMASFLNVGLGLFFGTARVEVKGGGTEAALGALVGLGVGDFVGLVPGTIGGQVFLHIV